MPSALQASAVTGAVAGLFGQNLGAVFDAHQQHQAVGVAGGDDVLLGMAGDHLDAVLGRRQDARLLAHRAVLASGTARG